MLLSGRILFAPASEVCDLALPVVGGGDTGFVRLGNAFGVADSAAFNDLLAVAVACPDAFIGGFLPAASSARIWSALLGGFSARSSYVILLRFAAGSPEV